MHRTFMTYDIWAYLCPNELYQYIRDTSLKPQPCLSAPREGSGRCVRSDRKQLSACKSDDEGQAS